MKMQERKAALRTVHWHRIIWICVIVLFSIVTLINVFSSILYPFGPVATVFIILPQSFSTIPFYAASYLPANPINFFFTLPASWLLFAFYIFILLDIVALISIIRLSPWAAVWLAFRFVSILSLYHLTSIAVHAALLVAYVIILWWVFGIREKFPTLQKLLPVVWIIVLSGITSAGIWVWAQQTKFGETTTANWKTYRLVQYGASFKYPPSYVITDENSETVSFANSQECNDKARKNEGSRAIPIAGCHFLTLVTSPVSGGRSAQPANTTVGSYNAKRGVAAFYSYVDIGIVSEIEGIWYAFSDTTHIVNRFGVEKELDAVLSTFSIDFRQEEWKTFSSDTYGYQISFPPDWQISDDGVKKVVLFPPDASDKETLNIEFFPTRRLPVGLDDNFKEITIHGSPALRSVTTSLWGTNIYYILTNTGFVDANWTNYGQSGTLFPIVLETMTPFGTAKQPVTREQGLTTTPSTNSSFDGTRIFAASDEWQTITDIKNGFQFNYPPSWSVYKNNEKFFVSKPGEKENTAETVIYIERIQGAIPSEYELQDYEFNGIAAKRIVYGASDYMFLLIPFNEYYLSLRWNGDAEERALENEMMNTFRLL